MRTQVDGVAVLGVTAASGTGKTTLLRGVLPHLRAQGLRVGCIKHTHHDIEIDRPGKDSHVLRSAGAQQMLLTAPRGWALMVDTTDAHDDDFSVVVRRLDLGALDVVLVEGYKFEDFAKIALHRHALSGPLVMPQDANVIAVATDQQPLPACAVPSFALDDVARIAAFILRHCTTLGSLPAGITRT